MNPNSQTTPTFMDDVRSVLKEISGNPHQGVAIRYCADELLARWDGEAPKPGGPAGSPSLTTDCALSTDYIQTVPDKCDRIVWRNRYYHLPLPEAGAGVEDGCPDLPCPDCGSPGICAPACPSRIP